ncbi:hypothetical protein RHMOL_Rhmol04G0036200 [Rhododendron molle]|uniref:Uncharacterized protein n=1 Tax=Rhododendron molle TaxID=49168 RepID=A0ACC0NYE9_RHOML|nr:hypothetical protein RHMOL_Rhmol04G0036200 [Rhododendron molle]
MDFVYFPPNPILFLSCVRSRLICLVLHDWQRGKIPFFVPPPKEEGGSLKDEPNERNVEKDNAVDKDQASAARRAIANVISSQQAKDVPVQKDLAFR